MQERQVTVDGITHHLDRPFLVVATQNPIEYEGTYPLPEAQLDRFIVRIGVGYPTPADEWQVLEQRLARKTDDIELEVIVDAETLRAMQKAVESVHVSESVGRYIVDLVGATRHRNRVLVGASPRGSLAIMKVARARAILRGRDFVTPDDVKSVAVPALAHRLVLRPELWVQDIQGDDIVAECWTWSRLHRRFRSDPSHDSPAPYLRRSGSAWVGGGIWLPGVPSWRRSPHHSRFCWESAWPFRMIWT